MGRNPHLASVLDFLAQSASIETGFEGIGTFELSQDKCDGLARIFQAVLKPDYPAAVEELKSFEHDERPQVRNFFSAHVLKERKKEWTGHGINRTFRFWSEAEKQDYLRFTVQVLDALASKYDACLGYGSVLSIVRDGDLVPHDDDLDIIVSMRRDSIASYKAGLAEVEKFLTDSGFSVRGDYVAHRHVTNGRFFLDVFFGLEDGRHVSWHPGPREVMLKESVFPAKTETLFGIDCLVPKDSEAYLATVYGENWRTPLPGWTHDFDPTKYADWFWPKPG